MFAKNPESGVQFFTDDPNVAKNFSEDSIFGTGAKKYKHVILSGKVPRDLHLFNLETDQVCHPDLAEYLGEDDPYSDIDDEPLTEKEACITFSNFIASGNDPTDIYQFIDDSKYDGAFHIAVDSKGNEYNDFALFKPETITFDSVQLIDPKRISMPMHDDMIPFSEGKKSFMTFCRARTLDEFI